MRVSNRTRRLPSDRNPLVASGGWLLLSAAYVTMGASLLAGTNNEALLVPSDSVRATNAFAVVSLVVAAVAMAAAGAARRATNRISDEPWSRS